MPIAFDPSVPWEYILEAERGAEKPTVFLLAAITVGAEAVLQDKLVSVDGATKTTRVQSGTHELSILRSGLVGWRDFYDAKGDPVPFETDRGRMVGGRAQVADASLDRLRPRERREIAEAIVERNTLSESEAKNS